MEIVATNTTRAKYLDARNCEIRLRSNVRKIKARASVSSCPPNINWFTICSGHRYISHIYKSHIFSLLTASLGS